MCFWIELDVECGTPESIKNGRYFLATNVTYYGAALHYECDENYQLEGHARRLCLENGTWSSETPMCKGNLIFLVNIGDFIFHFLTHLPLFHF